jgi:NADH-quinone oxidoreductase subunit M
VTAREFWMLMVLAVAVLVVGVWPAPFVTAMDSTLGALLEHVVRSKL